MNRKPLVLKSLKSTFLSFPEVAELLGVTERTIRDWVCKKGLIEFRLHKLSRNRVRPIVTVNEVMRLMDIVRPVFRGDGGSEQEQIWLENHEKRVKAGMASASARARKKEQQRP